MTHDELQHDLACHLRGCTDRMVWENTQLGPAASPRPDVFTINKSYARFAADAYEIKVSIADLRRDTTSGKWQSYRKFAHRVWFAFERGLAKLDEVPRECGVVLHGPGGWRAARKPIAQVLDSLPRDAWLKLLIESQPTAPSGLSPRQASEWHLNAVARRKFGDEVADVLRDRQSADSDYRRQTERLRASTAEIAKEVANRRQLALANTEAAAERLRGEMAELGAALGMLPDEITAARLTHKLRDLRWKLHRSGIDGAIETLRALALIVRQPAPQEAAA